MYTILIIVLIFKTSLAALRNELKYTKAFDNDLYERVLDPLKCEEQLDFLRGNFDVALQFIDASGKIPKGILLGNLVDLGNYQQCLEIDHTVDELNIEGKYCMIKVPLQQNVAMKSVASPTFPYMDNVWPTLGNDVVENIERLMKIRKHSKMILGHKDSLIRSDSVSSYSNSALSLSLGICVPKVCRSKEALDPINFLNLTYHEDFCRLPNDKPISVADYVAISIFSLIILTTIISTSYDIYQTYALKRDKSQINTLYSCFSVHTNTVRFLSFNKSPGALDCIDGIRAISMIWVVVGHTYYLTTLSYMTNPITIMSWLTSFWSTWINAAPIAVDTFFALSGILCVYTVVGKINRCQFIKSLHLFYLHRLLRIFPLLATVVLLQASLFHRVADGPAWRSVGLETEFCRKRWWAALLHVQNYIKPLDMCIGHSWYLSVDIQLYIFSPVVIVWLFGSTAVASCFLTAAVLISLAITSTYSFLNKYPASVYNPSHTLEQTEAYFYYYYLNTLTRASPFIVGMLYGYILHKFRGRKLRLRKSLVLISWVLALAIMGFCIFIVHPIIQFDYEVGFLDYFLNSYMRGIWALTLGWLIFACVHGYGGPINWFLTLQLWKIPARLSYAMYLIHFPIMIIANGTMTSTYYFTDANTIYRFFGDLVFTLLASFVLCIVIDGPFSTLLKLLLDKVSGKAKTSKNIKTESQVDIVETDENENKINKLS